MLVSPAFPCVLDDSSFSLFRRRVSAGQPWVNRQTQGLHMSQWIHLPLNTPDSRLVLDYFRCSGNAAASLNLGKKIPRKENRGKSKKFQKHSSTGAGESSSSSYESVFRLPIYFPRISYGLSISISHRLFSRQPYLLQYLKLLKERKSGESFPQWVNWEEGNHPFLAITMISLIKYIYWSCEGSAGNSLTADQNGLKIKKKNNEEEIHDKKEEAAMKSEQDNSPYWQAFQQFLRLEEGPVEFHSGTFLGEFGSGGISYWNSWEISQQNPLHHSSKFQNRYSLWGNNFLLFDSYSLFNGILPREAYSIGNIGKRIENDDEDEIFISSFQTCWMERNFLKPILQGGLSGINEFLSRFLGIPQAEIIRKSAAEKLAEAAQKGSKKLNDSSDNPLPRYAPLLDCLLYSFQATGNEEFFKLHRRFSKPLRFSQLVWFSSHSLAERPMKIARVHEIPKNFPLFAYRAIEVKYWAHEDLRDFLSLCRDQESAAKRGKLQYLQKKQGKFLDPTKLPESRSSYNYCSICKGTNTRCSLHWAIDWKITGKFQLQEFEEGKQEEAEESSDEEEEIIQEEMEIDDEEVKDCSSEESLEDLDFSGYSSEDFEILCGDEEIFSSEDFLENARFPLKKTINFDDEEFPPLSRGKDKILKPQQESEWDWVRIAH